MKTQITPSDNDFTKTPVETSIKIAMTLLLFIWCFQIVQPFTVPLVWSLIITVSIYPVYSRILPLLGNRKNLAAILMIIALLLIVVVPLIILTGKIATSIEALAKQLLAGTFSIPLPTEKVASWPLIGDSLFKYWTLIATKPMEALAPIAPQLKTVGSWLVSTGVSFTTAILQLVLAIIISGVLLAHADGGHQLALAIAKRFVGKRGEEFEELCEATIRGVAIGVVGVALIQSSLIGLGFAVMDIPAAAVLTLFCFFLALIQVGPSFIVFPVAIYVFSSHDTLPSILFLFWSLFTGLIDNVLKPLLMGRGSRIPMVVIFLGAIGGMITSGLIGLFVGSVVLALGYELFRAWVFQDE
ncbi:Putative transport protein YdiK [uncultured bacterium]|nr:Putative transport protein YdiK [uncultured bacterium]